MVVFDSTFMLLVVYPDVPPPIDPNTGDLVTKPRERIDHLIQNLSDAGVRVMVPTPVLSEVLVKAGSDKDRILSEISSNRAFRVQAFDQRCAVEVAMLAEREGSNRKVLTNAETWAKVKYDRQILATAKVHEVRTIFSDDQGLCAKARANGIEAVSLWDVALPPEPPQGELELPTPESTVDD